MSRSLTSLPRTACWISSSWMTAPLRPSTEPWSERRTRSGCSGETPAWRRMLASGGSGGWWKLQSYVNHLICIDIDNIYSLSELGDPPSAINLLCYVHWTWEIIYLSICLSAWIIVTGMNCSEHYIMASDGIITLLSSRVQIWPSLSQLSTLTNDHDKFRGGLSTQIERDEIYSDGLRNL